jgi:hypothetical protein
MTNYVDVRTSAREATFPTLYEAEYWAERVLGDYPSMGYNTSCSIRKLEGNAWRVDVNRWNSCD